MTSTEGDLLREIAAVYGQRGRAFASLAMACTGDHGLADDAVQEGFARAIKGREGFRGTGSLEAWISRCVLNAARDITSRRPHLVGDAAETPAPATSDRETVNREIVRSAIRALPKRQRDALFLRFYLDLEYTEIAEALDMEVGTVSSTLHKARATLGKALEEVAA